MNTVSSCPDNCDLFPLAAVAPLFNGDVYPLGYTWLEKRIGSAVDFYNVQYYNQGAYGTCETLVRKADGFAPKTSLLEVCCSARQRRHTR